ncbi:TraB/GumN family protein [Alteromonas sediminis]|uniref:TraB/GumN family protein n=1 Tax=Alteromonas sediminis TaxID=2259342 RepID=UPI001404AE64|nr:TraB/GumN family protein [Alteromonas sediminis]
MLSNIKKAFKLAALPIALTVSNAVWADSSVWKVSKGDAHLFVGGTVHLLPADQFPLPEEFEKAYKASESIVLEVIDLDPQSPEIQQKIMANMMYQDGRTLQSVLSEETYQQLAKVCAEYGMPIENLTMFKPALISIMLTMAEFTNLGMAGEGVDKFFEEKAKSDNKARSGLETIDYQISVISSFGEGVEEDFVKKTLADLPKTKEMFGGLIKAWRAGDMDSLHAIMGEAMLGYSEELYYNLLVKRNNDWVPKISDMLTTKEVEFILVGAGHLAGEEGVLQQLINKGYTVEQL